MAKFADVQYRARAAVYGAVVGLALGALTTLATGTRAYILIFGVVGLITAFALPGPPPQAKSTRPPGRAKA